MKPILTFFFDGLKPDSLAHMPFLNSLSHRRLRTLLGYSITCHASMYSGVYPNKHLMWFVWQHSPETSPFRWLHSARLLQYLDSLPMRLLVQRITNRVQKRHRLLGRSANHTPPSPLLAIHRRCREALLGRGWLPPRLSDDLRVIARCPGPL